MPKTLWLALALFAGLAGFVVGTSRAQIDEPSPCEQACFDQEERCVSACGERPDPVECEAGCRDAADQCRMQCQ